MVSTNSQRRRPQFYPALSRRRRGNPIPSHPYILLEQIHTPSSIYDAFFSMSSHHHHAHTPYSVLRTTTKEGSPLTTTSRARIPNKFPNHSPPLCFLHFDKHNGFRRCSAFCHLISDLFGAGLLAILTELLWPHVCRQNKFLEERGQ